MQNGHLRFTTNVQISSRESPVTSFTYFCLYPFKDMISRTRNMLMVFTEQHAHDSLFWSLRVQPNSHPPHQINIACTRSLFATCQLLNLPQFSDVLKMTEGFNRPPRHQIRYRNVLALYIYFTMDVGVNSASKNGSIIVTKIIIISD